MLSWNGTAWTQVPSPTPRTSGNVTLRGVAGVSAARAWAVGGGSIVAWNGTSWK